MAGAHTCMCHARMDCLLHARKLLRAEIACEPMSNRQLFNHELHVTDTVLHCQLCAPRCTASAASENT